MAVWELALLLLALTYTIVNMVCLIVMIKILAKYDGLFTKVLKLTEKVLNKTEKELSDDEEA